jgi:uncharacterized membrane protein YfcA
VNDSTDGTLTTSVTASSDARPASSRVVRVVLVGLLAGFLSGLFGVGGGILIVPTSIIGTWRNRKNRNADLRVAGMLGMAGVLSAFVGGKISVGMSEQTSNILFAALLLVVAARMSWQVVVERGRRV